MTLYSRFGAELAVVHVVGSACIFGKEEPSRRVVARRRMLFMLGIWCWWITKGA
jgi:hypothetical protein